LPRCADLPRLSGIEELAGCLYVLEGASLGGQVIAPVLQRQLGLAKDRGLSFFIGDAAGTPARWRLVLDSLELLARAGAETDRIISSACATFLTFARWVERESRPPAGVGERRRG
jgi:heme oxygenase